MLIENLDILLRLLVAYFLSEFVLQPNNWKKDRKENDLKSPWFYGHTALIGFTSYLFLADWGSIGLPLAIAGCHFFIDFVILYFSEKHKESTRITAFLAVSDQVLHLLAISSCWILLSEAVNREVVWKSLQNFLTSPTTWWILLGYLLNGKPIGVIIGLLTKRWAEADKHNTGLKDAGKWIGYLERTLIFTFIAVGNLQLTAVGFLLGAKSIFRFGDLTESKNRSTTEYIMIGTLTSFTCSILLSMLIRGLMFF